MKMKKKRLTAAMVSVCNAPNSESSIKIVIELIIQIYFFYYYLKLKVNQTSIGLLVFTHEFLVLLGTIA